MKKSHCVVQNHVVQVLVPGINRKMDLRLVKQGFSSFFCLIFAIFDDFSKFHSTFIALQFEKSSNMAKNEENLVRLAFNPFLHGTAGRYPKPRLRVPIPPSLFCKSALFKDLIAKYMPILFFFITLFSFLGASIIRYR